jgi:ribosomal protein L19E
VITGLAVYIVNRFRIRNLSNAMTAIVNKYKNYKESPDENNKGKYIHQFEDMREEVLKLLQKGKIDENKYKMLDDQISSYIQNISKDLEKSKSGH